MPKIRVRPRHQVTIPARIARAAGIKPDDLLDVEVVNGVVTLSPTRRAAPGAGLMRFAGIGRGVWGGDAAAVDAELARSRASWER